MFTLTLALPPSPERTLTFTSAFRGNGVARACGLKRPRCLFHMGLRSLKNRKVLARGVTAKVAVALSSPSSYPFLLPALGPGSYKEDHLPYQTCHEARGLSESLQRHLAWTLLFQGCQVCSGKAGLPSLNRGQACA